MNKQVQEVIECVIDAIPDYEVMAIGEALGRVSAHFLAQVGDDEFEVWIKAVRKTRKYIMKHLADN